MMNDQVLDDLMKEVAAVFILFAPDLLSSVDPIPMHNSALTGAMYYAELMSSESEVLFKSFARMDRQTFLGLVQFLEEYGGLQNSLQLCSGEKFFILLFALTGYTIAGIAGRWQHSVSTISDVVHEVAHCFMHVKHILIRRPNPDIIPDRINNNPKFTPVFDNSIGALDGTHVHAVARGAEGNPFRDRKGNVSQNVLGVCDFDGVFTYILAGWEGSAGDQRVLGDARLKELCVFLERFYLADGGYALSRWCLTPYRGVRYHLKEFSRGPDGPQNMKELFNLRHAMLRNVIERTFGVLKKRFDVLNKMHSFSIQMQIELIMCCVMIHNYIRKNQAFDDEFEAWVPPEVEVNAIVPQVPDEVPPTHAERVFCKQWRDAMAVELWNQYVTYMDINHPDHHHHHHV